MMASTRTPYANDGDDPEMQKFISTKPNPSSSNNTAEPSFLQRIMLSIDEKTNVKVLMDTWQPRLEFAIRLMLVATFFDDSFHTLLDLSEHLQKVNAFVLMIGILAQIFGSLCIVGSQYIDWSTKALIAWLIVQPILYNQASNFDLMMESCSLVGGLLLLRSHMVKDSWSSRTQLLGRLLLPAMYLYDAGVYMTRFYMAEAADHYQNSTFASYSKTYLDNNTDVEVLDETDRFANLPVFVIAIAIMIGLLIGAPLVAIGLKSRFVALLLALFNFGFVCYQHPFWTYIYRQGGEWKYEKDMPLPTFSVTNDISQFNVDPSLIYDLHRYYFFLSMSTTAGLLLLTVTGPGKVAVQNDEIILPQVGRAQD